MALAQKEIDEIKKVPRGDYAFVTWDELKGRFDGAADKGVLVVRYDGDISFSAVRK